MTADMLDSVLPPIARRATDLDQSGRWPSEDFAALAAVGSTQWVFALSPLDLHLIYRRIAAASLAMALVLSQRDSAASLILASAGPARAELLSGFSQPRMFATIGIAQLTTSRQGGRPALRAESVDGGFRIDGQIPWSTGADQSDFVVAGAMMNDSRQILFALPTNLPGVSIAPLPLVALAATHTCSISCDGVRLDERWILRGPAEKVLSGNSKGLPLGQTFLAMGLCRGGLDLIAAHDSERARSAVARFDEQLTALSSEILALSQPGVEAPASAENARLRGACNDLALRISHAAVALYKGTALLQNHPAQRLAPKRCSCSSGHVRTPSLTAPSTCSARHTKVHSCAIPALPSSPGF